MVEALEYGRPLSQPLFINWMRHRDPGGEPIHS
jgi:hypothetical protein